MRRSIPRREFLKNSAILAAGLSLPLLSGCAASTRVKAGKAPGRPGPADRINLGVVGFGTIAHDTIVNFLGDPRVQVVAVADPVRELGNYGYKGDRTGGRLAGQRRVEAHYAAQAGRAYKGCRVYEDFRDMFDREDLDGIVINTPDHWHCAIAIHAARRGLHIYGQKPLALTVGEGRRMAQEVAAAGITWQTGSQQRSSVYFRMACEFVRNGRIGKLKSVRVGLPGGHVDWSLLASRQKPEKVPAGLNHDLWLGPAAERPYIPALQQMNWRNNFAFSGGMITDWGAHHLDILQWALDMDSSGPVRIEINSAVLPPADAVYNTVPDFDFDLVYATGLRVNVSNRHENGLLFEGEDGRTIFVRRDLIETTPEDLRRQRIEDGEIRLYESRLHERNFVDCIYSNTPTITPVEVSHRAISIAHMANIAIRLGRSSLDWSPSTEQFVDDEAANKMLTRPMRRRYAV
jgi:predicted dehydrogenase